MIKIDTTFTAVYADGSCNWKVIGKAGKDAWKAVITDLDYAGTVKLFSSNEINASIGWSKFARESEKNHESFYSSLITGQIVHYHNGFNSFVRCVVTQDKTLRPIGLVGNWSSSDLPKRQLDGTIYYPYHAKKILNKESFTPNASNIYECVPSNKVDPRSLKEIDLSVPDETDEQKVLAEKVRKIKLIRELTDILDAENVDRILADIRELTK